jgi:hypothetical protein
MPLRISQSEGRCKHMADYVAGFIFAAYFAKLYSVGIQEIKIEQGSACRMSGVRFSISFMAK